MYRRRTDSDGTINMTQGQPLRLLVVFALPLMFGNMFQQLYTVVDTAIVGHGVGMEALAALGMMDWLNWMIFSISQGFSQGISILVSQKYGEGDKKNLPGIVGEGACLTILIALALTAAGVLGVPHFLRLMNAPDELKPMAQLYSTILFGGFSAAAFYNFTASMLRAVGDSRTPLAAMITASLLNIALDALAVFVLGLGIAGAAGATVLAQCTAGIICLLRMRKIPELTFGRRQLRLTRQTTRELVRLSLPVSMMNMIIAVGGVFVQSIVNTFGVSFIAGYTATNKLYGLLEIAAVSYGYAVTTYVGQNYGAKDAGRITKGVRTAAYLSLGTSAAIGLVMIVFGRLILRLFLSSEDPAAFEAAMQTAYTFLCIMAASLPILYLLYVYRSALQGLGRTSASMVSGILEFCMRVGCALLVMLSRFETGLFIAEVAAWSGAAAFLAARYYICRARLYTEHA